MYYIGVVAKDKHYVCVLYDNGAFSENIYSYLTDSDYKVILLNAYQTAISIIKVYPTAIDIGKATPKKLTKIFRHIKGNNFNEEKAIKLISLSKSSIYTGRAYESRALMIKTNIKILELLIQEKESIEIQINELINTQFEDVSSNIEHIKSIPGVSDKTISSIIGECGDLKRFKIFYILSRSLSYSVPIRKLFIYRKTSKKRNTYS